MFPYKNSVSLRYVTTCSLTCFIGCNSGNSVQTVIIIEVRDIHRENTFYPYIYTDFSRLVNVSL